MGFPTYDPRYADKRVRQAFSMAIDREAITEAIFNGTRTPAVLGHRAGRRRLPRRRLQVLQARRREGQPAPRRGRLRPAASRSTCGSTPAPVTTPGWRPWATSCARTWAWSSPCRATSTSPSTCPRVTPRASPGRSVSAGAWTTRARRTTSSRCTRRRRSAAGRFELRVLPQPGVRRRWSRRATRPPVERRGDRRLPAGRGRPAGGHAGHADVLRPGADRAGRRTSSNVVVDIFGRVDVAEVTVNG